MPFTFNIYGSIGNNVSIESVSGSLTIDGNQVLSKKSGAQDLARQLKQVRSTIEQFADIDKDVKSAVLDAIDSAERETLATKPKAREIKGHLDRAASTLKSATGLADKALGLGKILVEIGKWAVATLT